MRGEALAFLTEHRETRVPDLTVRLVETIVAGNRAYTGTAVPLADLETSCRDNIARVLELLAVAVTDGAPEGHEAYYDAARATGERRAGQGLPLHDVLRSFRIGGRLIWDDLVAQARDSLDAEALREVGTRLWQVVDETSAQVALAYHDTERSLVRADAQRKAALWEGLLGGRAADPSFALEAVRILDLPESGPYVVVATADHASAPLESALRNAGLRSEWVRRATGVVAVVAPGARQVRSADRALAQWVAQVLGPAAGATAVGLSVEVNSVTEVDRAFRQATLAAQARATGARAVGVTCFDEALPEALLLTSAEVAGRLVDVWLGAVLALPDGERRDLLATLDAWVATGGAAGQASELVHCHRNTVLNRLRRVAELTGQPAVAGSCVPVELALALRAVRVLPPG